MSPDYKEANMQQKKTSQLQMVLTFSGKIAGGNPLQITGDNYNAKKYPCIH